MRIRTYSAAAAAAAALAVAAPVAGAGAATVPAASGPASLPPAALVFVPPSVGVIRVHIGPVIIGGQVISPGVHVVKPAVSLPPLRWRFGSGDHWR